MPRAPALPTWALAVETEVETLALVSAAPGALALPGAQVKSSADEVELQ